jgi:putative salt-induced outer membrane protein YdiY
VSRRRLLIVTVLVSLASAGLDRASAQTTAQDPKEKKLGWSNTADLSLVVTEGNSAARTFGFSDHLRYVWPDARFTVDATGVQSDTSDDRYFVVQAGVQFPIGGRPVNPTTTLVKPEPTSDVRNYLVGGRYDKDINKWFFWNAGASWDHNKDAGIERRYTAFAGVGNKWADSGRRRFVTDYGISYTDRKEEEPDPEKEPRFGGLRIGWSYTENFNKTTTFDSIFASNTSLAHASDASINTTNSLSVAMNNHLSLKASVQWLFESKPALETGLDVIAFVEVVNPDGIPGSGDEFFRTQSSGGVKLVVGTADARKDKLDTIFRTSLVISF